MCKFLFLLKIPFLLFDFRKSEKERMREYRRELEEREEKLKSNKRNPLLQVGNLDDNDDLLIKTMVSW